MPHSNFKQRATEFNTGVGSVPAAKPMNVHWKGR